MKKWIAIACLLAVSASAFAAGILTNNRSIYVEPCTLLRSNYEVNICNEFAEVKVTETFRQNYTHYFVPKYIFPLPETASATSMRWFYDGIWHTATLSVQPQAPFGNPGYISTEVLTYLGEYPFHCLMSCYPAYNDTLRVEFTYIQMLDYRNGDADLYLKNNIFILQNTPVWEQSLHAEITSERDMTDVLLLSHTPATVINNVHSGLINYSCQDQLANTDYHLRYSMAYEHPGLQVMSTYKDADPDGLGQGYFSFYAEPDPANSNVNVRKVYSIVIDISNSMNDDERLVQAQQASNYIVDNLNSADYFNILAYSSDVHLLWTSHRPNTPANVSEAHNFIDILTVHGGTNIQLAFSTAINQFGPQSDSLANIIIFMTDGAPTEGIVETLALSQYVDDLIEQTDTGINVFCFGLGTEIGEELLILLSEHNNGFATFVEVSEIYNAIVDFYNSICNPTLVSPVLTVTPQGFAYEIFPQDMTNLYLGRQVVICGRYLVPMTVEISLAGHIFGHPVTYTYQVELSGTDQMEYSFLPQLWAKKKLEVLLLEYSLLLPDDAEAIALMQQIVQISSTYSVLAIYNGNGPLDNPDEDSPAPGFEIRLQDSYPNPFSSSVSIRFQTGRPLSEPVELRIYNVKGQLVRAFSRYAKSAGIYELDWDGKNDQGNNLAEGIYFLTLSSGNTIHTGKMTLLK